MASPTASDIRSLTASRPPRRARLGARLAALAAAVALLSDCARIATAPIPIVTVMGSVSLPNGAPVADVSIYFVDASGADAIDLVAIGSFRAVPRAPGATGRASKAVVSYRAMTRFDGKFTIDLPAQAYKVYLYPPNGSGVPAASEIRYVVGRKNPRFDYRYSGIAVTGAVTGPAGEPVTNTFLTFTNSRDHISVVAQFDGTRYGAYLPPGNYAVDVEPPSWTGGIPEILFRNVPIAADTTIDFALTGHLVTGTVTAPDGSPIAAANVYIDSDYARSGANSDAAGHYSMYVPGGMCTPYSYPPVTRRDIVARFFDDVDVTGPMTVDLDFRGVTWQGVVREAESGGPIAGATIDIIGYRYLGYSYLGKAHVVTGSDGAFRLYLPGADQYRLIVAAPGFARVVLESVTAGSDSTFDLPLNPAVVP